MTDPKGIAHEISLSSGVVDGDGYLKPQIPVTGSIRLSEGVTLFEVVREDGLAYANIPLIFGNVWSIIPKTPREITGIIRTDTAQIQEETLLRVNEVRAQVGALPVKLDPSLSRLAQEKVRDMIVRGYQGHADPDGKFIDSLAQKIGISVKGSLGENIAYGNISDRALQDGLEESGVHRHNIQNPDWKKIGIGYDTKNGKVYLVQVF